MPGHYHLTLSAGTVASPQTRTVDNKRRGMMVHLATSPGGRFS